MTTNVRARRLIADHHGLRATLAEPPVTGIVTDTLIGEESTEVEIDGDRYVVGNETLVALEVVA